MESSAEERRTSTGLQLTAGFSSLVVFVQLILYTAVGATAAYVSLYAYLNQVTISQQQRAEELLLALGAASRSAYEAKNLATLSNDFNSLKERSTSRPLDILIDEVFFLSKNGSILAHSDFTKVSPATGSALDRLSSEYNNSFYHAAIQLQPGQIETRRLKTRQPVQIEKSVRFLSAFFPWEMESALNYSAPMYSKDQAVGTIHLVVQNNLIQNAIRRILNEFSGFLIILSAAAVISAVLLLVIFAYQLQRVRQIWEAYLARRIEQQRRNQNQLLPEKEPTQSSKPEPEKKPSEPVQKQEKPIYDAILLDE